VNPLEKFFGDLPDKDCRIGLYSTEVDLHYSEGLKPIKSNKIVFIIWIPENAPAKKKAIYTAGKDALRFQFGSVQTEWTVRERFDGCFKSELKNMLEKSLCGQKVLTLR